jgi:prepilin-type N-terminal cleavage/methylation domain-containing protein
VVEVLFRAGMPGLRLWWVCRGTAMRKRTAMTLPADRAAQGCGVSSRRGFSLIELLVAIVIIAILMALILPAIAGARSRAQVAQVTSDITQLDSAIAKFKSVYNVEPPSSLYIPAIGAAWPAADRSKVREMAQRTCT